MGCGWHTTLLLMQHSYMKAKVNQREPECSMPQLFRNFRRPSPMRSLPPDMSWSFLLRTTVCMLVALCLVGQAIAHAVHMPVSGQAVELSVIANDGNAKAPDVGHPLSEGAGLDCAAHGCVSLAPPSDGLSIISAHGGIPSISPFAVATAMIERVEKPPRS